jgi:hypothetical protein
MSSELQDHHHKKTAVLLIAPETGRLPNGMGPLARFISGKSGGMGDVISTLCEGLTRRGVECHLATLNLTRRFQQENNLNDDQWDRIIHTIDPEHIHLVNSSILPLEKDAVIAMDRGYVDFTRLYAMNLFPAFFVIRAKSNLRCRRLNSQEVDKTLGLRSDQRIVLTVKKSRDAYCKS